MCGEKSLVDKAANKKQGSPPHVRGKGVNCHCLLQPVGITPACAGKSGGGTSASGECRDHPRMCGEKTKKIP